MSAAGRREELEARCWQAGLTLAAVEYILTAADHYAEALAGRELDRVEGQQRLMRAAIEYDALRPHGTPAAYRRHQRHGETPCEACRQARNRYQAEYRRARREAA